MQRREVAAAECSTNTPTTPLNVVFLGYVWPMFGNWCVVRVFISDVCIVLLCNLWVGISTHWTLPHHRTARPISLHHRNISHLHTGVIMGFYFKNLIKYQTQSDNIVSWYLLPIYLCGLRATCTLHQLHQPANRRTDNVATTKYRSSLSAGYVSAIYTLL